jgi:glycosyltransferase involved in cell wall biosynthesis
VQPLVSILIPAHNAARWVTETLGSAVEQTWPRKEVILVDDGSSDDTLAIARKFSSRIVTVIGQEKQGAAAARNRALTLSRGDYIQWLDADDLLARDKVERQMAVALRDDFSKRTLLSGPWGYFCYRARAAKFRPNPLWCDLSPVEWCVRKFEHNAHIQTATWLISRQLTEKAGLWDTRLLSNDDGEYMARIMKASDAVKFVPGAKVFYRVTTTSRLSYVGQSKAKVEAQLLGLQLQMQHLLELEDSERTRAACVQRLQTWFGNFYPERADVMLRVEQLANDLGGKLELPSLNWKYLWMQKLFGWCAVKKFRLRYRRLKSAVIRFWDLILFHVESRGSGSKRITPSTAPLPEMTERFR